MRKVTKTSESVNRMSHMTLADIIVRNDEVAGSIPASSTKTAGTIPRILFEL